MSARLERAYRATLYQAGGVVVRIGARSASLDAWLRAQGCRQAAFIAAGNPFSRRRPEGWNARRLAALKQSLRRLPCLSGQGQGRRWTEPHVLAALPPRRATVLARRFNQAAWVLAARGRPARLQWVSAG